VPIIGGRKASTDSRGSSLLILFFSEVHAPRQNGGGEEGIREGRKDHEEKEKWVGISLQSFPSTRALVLGGEKRGGGESSRERGGILDRRILQSNFSYGERYSGRKKKGKK